MVSLGVSESVGSNPARDSRAYAKSRNRGSSPVDTAKRWHTILHFAFCSEGEDTKVD